MRFAAFKNGRVAREEASLNVLDQWCWKTYSGSMNYGGRITMEAGKRGGKPCIRGLRITVYEVLEYLASGMSQEEILKDFPDLESEDIKACLAFAADRERKLFAPA
jgi:uncharacterized protein (DUF433 family)